MRAPPGTASISTPLDNRGPLLPPLGQMSSVGGVCLLNGIAQCSISSENEQRAAIEHRVEGSILLLYDIWCNTLERPFSIPDRPFTHIILPPSATGQAPPATCTAYGPASVPRLQRNYTRSVECNFNLVSISMLQPPGHGECE